MSVKQIARLPPVAVANRFSARRGDLVPSRELLLTLDTSTGLLSLGNPFTSRELRHSHEWLNYQEPESHCLALGEEVLKLIKMPDDKVIAGLSWKDSGLLASCAQFGLDTTLMNPRARQMDTSFESETWVTDSIDVQEMISNLDYGATDPRFGFLSARHILEHATSLEEFMAGLAKVVSQDGYVLFEVPDCEEAIALCDYSIIWEEHVHYFTADSLKRTLQKLGWRMVKISREIVEDEAVLIVLAQPPSPFSKSVASKRSEVVATTAVNFGENFAKTRMQIKIFLRNLNHSGTRLYLMGANHVASNFIDLFGEFGMFTACLDDNPNKQGKYISSQSVPILPLESLMLDKDSVVISAIHPGRVKVVEKRLMDTCESRIVIQRVSQLVTAAAAEALEKTEHY